MFQRYVDDNIGYHQTPETTDDIDRLLAEVQQVINRAEAENVPQISVQHKVIELDLATKYLIRLRNKCRRIYQRTGRADAKIMQRDLTAIIDSRLQELRNNNFLGILAN